MKSFEDLTRKDIENLLKIAYFEGISDHLTEQSNPNNFTTLEVFREQTKGEMKK